MAPEIDIIKKEMQALVAKDVPADSPEAIAWMEKAANIVRKDQLQPGQEWKHNPDTGLEKVWVN